MGRALVVLLALSCASTPSAPAPSLTPTATLVLEHAFALSGPGDFQPSALTIHQGRLYTASDKSSNALFEINLGGAPAGEINLGGAPAGEINLGGAPAEGEINLGGDRAVEINLGGVLGVEGRGLDLEGVAVDGAGDFLVVSEALGRVLRVRADGSARWVEIDFVGPARAAGLLATGGAGFEGLAVLGDRLVLAAEREPRGLVVARAGKVWAWQMERSAIPLPAGRRPDFADLAVDGERLFALVRNADAIVELVPAGDRFEEGRWWSFAGAVAAHPYQDQRFGMGEGLAMDARHLYVVLDNNGSPRRGAPEDRRAMLFVFRKPAW